MRVGLFLMVFAAVMAHPAAAADFVVEPGKPNEVVFLSKAPMESFEGKTREITGSLSLDPQRLSGTIEAEFTVDLASLDTGIGLRNRHMRENHLETDTYPTAVFKGGEITEASAASLSTTPATFTLTGTFTLHGVTQEMSVQAEAVQVEAGIQVIAIFEVKLSDYDIKRPKFLMLKLADEQAVTVNFTATPKAS